MAPRDRRETLSLLEAQPAENAYLLGQIARGALDREEIAGPILGYRQGGQLRGLCILGSNLVISHPASTEAIEAFAEYAKRSGVPFWVAVGIEETIQRFLQAYGRETRPIRSERGDQVLYELSKENLDGSQRSPGLRPAQLEDVEALLSLDQEMVREEIGFDPFSSVMSSYRQGWLRRVREGRAWVIGPLGGPLIFKVDQSAVARDVVQLAGIITIEARRGEGIGRGAVGEMCHRLLETCPRVTLYVHRDNRPAVGLYEALGFQARSLIRSVWYEP